MNAFFMYLCFVFSHKKNALKCSRRFLSSVLVVYAFIISDLRLLRQHLLHYLYIVQSS